MKRITMDHLNEMVAGLSIARAERTNRGIALHLSNDIVLELARAADGIDVQLRSTARQKRPSNPDAPTARQREYLAFIARFMSRHGIAPAESDIQRPFRVSGPSAHQMIVTLERRGFIERDRDLFGQVVPRSIRVLTDLS